MQTAPVNNVSFNAKIISSIALDSALELAQLKAMSGTKEGIDLASKFYNSLKTIENDQTVDVFFVDTKPIHFYPYMRLGKNTRLLEFFGHTQKDIAYSIIDGVNKLVQGKYPRNKISDEAKNVDLKSAFNKWI